MPPDFLACVGLDPHFYNGNNGTHTHTVGLLIGFNEPHFKGNKQGAALGMAVLAFSSIGSLLRNTGR